MERNFSFDDAKNLIHRHKRLQARLIDFMNADKRYMDMVSDISGRYITTEVLKELRNISVEELNRDKLGIRVKSLRQNGFSTYEDIFAASVYQLSAIKGISDDGANTIKNMVRDTYSAVKKSTKLKLSFDNRTKETTRLVTAVSQYLRARQVADLSTKLYDVSSMYISNAINDVEPATTVFKWLFSSKDKKNKAVNSYNYLQQKLNDSYGNEVNRLGEEYRNLDYYSENDVWADFQKDPIKYINTIEQIVPGLLGNDDSVYGL